MFNFTRVFPLLLTSLAISGCASWQIRSAEPAPGGVAGQPFKHASLSIAGRQGVSSDSTGYVTRNECRSDDLVEVEVRRDIDDTIISLLTLGIVSPATIYFFCEKPEIAPPCDCEDESGDTL